tara:strand:- start:260 stop:808 length:549 start_codon:yes stop_codon:yes gene_type:complete
MDLDEIKRRMNGAIEVFNQELAGVRTGRASATLLDPIKVNSYGTEVPLTQVGTVNVPEARLITIQVWDKGLVQNVEKAIRDSGLGLNPQIDSQIIRIPIPELNEERRKELAKIISKYAERARVSVRNVRRDGMDQLKKLEKEGSISQDEHKKLAADIQLLTDSIIGDVDKFFDNKSKEIMQI